MLANLHLKDQKANMIAAYGVESTKDLTEAQLDELINSLVKIEAKKKSPVSVATRKLRSRVLDLLTKLGVYKDSRDWSRVNAYLSKPTIAGKVLYLCTDDELSALIKKLYAIHKKQMKEIEQENYIASNN